MLVGRDPIILKTQKTEEVNELKREASLIFRLIIKVFLRFFLSQHEVTFIQTKAS